MHFKGKKTEQMNVWSGIFGKEYTDRNMLSVEQMDEKFLLDHRISRFDLYKLFLDDLERSAKILEIGSNVGNQLICLQKLGFTNLYGIELQSYAIKLFKLRTKNIQIMQGSAFDVPFKDNKFDLVFTSGLLIHISPKDIELVLNEVYRCTNHYILGYEYYADQFTEVTYRGNKKLLWKNDFAKLYLSKFKDLELLKEKRLNYSHNDNVDSMFLLRKM